MTGFAYATAGWGAAFAPAALLAGLGWRNGATDLLLLSIPSALSAATFGLLGTLAGLTIASKKGEGAVAGATMVAALPSGILSFFGLMGLFVVPDLLWLAAVVGFFLPGPIAAASTAWLLTRESHGTS